MRTPLIAIATTLLLAAAVHLSAQTPADSPAPNDNPIIQHCLLSAIDDAQVPAKEAGVITAINVREGQLVAKGDLLGQIDDAQAQMEKRKAMAEKNAAQVKADSDIEKRYDIASANVSKYEYLRKKEANERVHGAVSETEMQEAQLKWTADLLKIEQADLEAKIAKLTVDDKQAEVDAADEAINRRQIRSPLGGIIQEIVPHVGEWVKPGDSVFRVVRIDRLQVEGYLRGDKYNPWEINNRPVTVYATLARESEPVAFNGKITVVDQVIQAGNTFRVKASVENRLAPGQKDQWLLHPGETVSLRIELN